MKITFETPVIVGDLGNRFSVASMELITIAFNLKPFSGADNVNVSLTLRDPETGYQASFIYEDSAATPAYWSQVSTLQLSGQDWLQPLFDRLISDGKLPAGTLA